MRRIVGLVLLGFAGFLLAMAALVKWYAYPTLAVVPLDQDSVSKSVGEQMTYFDRGTRSEQTDTLTSTLRVIGDVEAAKEHGGNVAVWDKSTVTTTSDGTKISVGTIRSAIERTSGEAVDCCDANIDAEAVDYDGLVFKFPFNTQKQSYDWWDEDLRRAVPFEYVDEQDVQGLHTLHFHMNLEPEQSGEIDLPPGLLGETGEDVITGEIFYANERDYYVEPETGVIIKAVENLNTTVRYNGEDRLVATRGTTGYPEDQIAANIKEYKGLSGQLHLVRVLAPMIGLIGGLLALLLGALLVLSSRATTQDEADAATTSETPTE
jgi:Porin PorA